MHWRKRQTAEARSLKENGGFTSLEKLCDDALIRYVKDAKYVSFGIEPILAYAVAKQMEIKSVENYPGRQEGRY